MFPRTDSLDNVTDLAKAQHGVLARRQLVAMGMSSTTVRRRVGAWTVLLPGVYLTTPTFDEPTHLARTWAGILYAGDDACAWALTAGILHGLVGEDERTPAPWRDVALGELAGSGIHVLTPGRKLRGQPGYAFSREISGGRITKPGLDPPRTGIDDTVLDMCAASSADEVVTWLTRACQRRLTTVRALRGRLEARPTLRHRGLIQEILMDVEAGAATALERHGLRDVFRAHGLPEAQWQMRGGGHIIDAVFPLYRVVVEFDGRIGHVEEGLFRDRRRDNKHTVRGMSTLRYGWEDVVGDPCGVAAEIAVMLSSRGWPGTPEPCPGCVNRPIV